jgi:hypothetical protein
LFLLEEHSFEPWKIRRWFNFWEWFCCCVWFFLFSHFRFSIFDFVVFAFFVSDFIEIDFIFDDINRDVFLRMIKTLININIAFVKSFYFVFDSIIDVFVDISFFNWSLLFSCFASSSIWSSNMLLLIKIISLMNWIACNEKSLNVENLNDK